MRVIIVGGGIVGLATARLIATERPEDEVIVLEKERTVGVHQTGHNSGVVHAGLYYAPGSLKARLCRRGVGLLKTYCEEHGLAYEECGKLVVALDGTEVSRLDDLEQRAIANGVPEVRRLDEDGLRSIEPHAAGIAALHSPSTAITDFRAVAEAFAADVVAAGGVVRTDTGAAFVRAAQNGAKVVTDAGEDISADRVVVCAGLHADRLARLSGEDAGPRIVPFRGLYYSLRPERSGLVSGLIYPVPNPALPFLGIHLTRKVDGSVWLGPNAVLALAREGYRGRDIRARDIAETLFWPGTPRMMRQHWRVGASEIVRTASKRAFIREAARYVPELTRADAVPARAGVRAQAVDRDGSLVDDFRLGGGRFVTWVRNAPSPAATSSMAIAEEIVSQIGLTSPGSAPNSRPGPSH
jgi:L-2-hydroxyglutarate oxidase LhgO